MVEAEDRDAAAGTLPEPAAVSVDAEDRLAAPVTVPPPTGAVLKLSNTKVPGVGSVP